MNGGNSPRLRVEPGAGHHPQVDVTGRGDALLEQQAGLDERLSGSGSTQLVVRLAVALELRLAVLVEALAAGLGAELALVDELLHPAVDVEAVAVGLVQVLGDVEDGVEAEEVGEHERAHRRVLLLGDLGVDLLDRESLLLLGAPELADGRVEDPVDDEARDLAAGDRLLADRLREVVRRLHRLPRGLVAGDDLEQRHHRGRVEEVEARRPCRAAASRRPSR